MGSSTWSDDSYRHIKQDYSTKSTDKIFTSKTIDSEMLPKGIKFRESRDSDAHPESLAICVFLDETGSMGTIPEILAREKLGALMTTLIKHDILHPQIMFCGIGDHYSDRSPLQVSQFESGTTELDKWLTKIHLEGNGGGQNMESYLLAWLFAARHTSIDCFEKREEKGFLFTIGDEGIHAKVEADKLKELMGYGEAEDISAEQLLHEAQRTYHVFHLHINEAQHKDDARVIGQWKRLLGENLIIVEDYNSTAEIIASTVALVHGVDLQKITDSFDSITASTVSNALAHVSKGSLTKKDKQAVKNL